MVGLIAFACNICRMTDIVIPPERDVPSEETEEPRAPQTINAFFSSGPCHPRQAGELSEPAAKSERKWVEHGLLLDFLSP